MAELCDGIAISASRLRAAARGSKERAMWSPNVTSSGWQWMAQAAAVTSHLNELMLRSLAVRVRQFAGPDKNGTRLNAAADSMADMRAAWRQVDQVWDMMITGRGLGSRIHKRFADLDGELQLPDRSDEPPRAVFDP